MFVPRKGAQGPSNMERDSQVELQVEQDEYVGHNQEEEIIDINVAGKRFQTYSKTLAKFPDSLLGSKERRLEFYNPLTNELFFDRHRPTFEAILYYYQSGGIMSKPPNIPIHIFINELIFFDIGNELIEKLQIDNGLKEVEVLAELPKYEPFRVVWTFLEDPASSKSAKIFAISSVIVIVLSLIMFVIETLPDISDQVVVHNGTKVTVPSKHAKWMFQVNTTVVVWFTIEFILRLICCPNKFRFFISPGNIIDFLSVLPYYLNLLLASNDGGSRFAMLRVIRVLRVFKLSRHSRGLQILGNTLKASFNELLMLGFFLFVMILIFGSCVYYAEYQMEDTKFQSIPNAFWWAIVTMTTVGYGDMYPKTFWGQIIGSMAVVSGVLTIALPVPVVVSNFEYFYTKERNRRKTEEARKEQDRKEEKTNFVKEPTSGKFANIRKYFNNLRQSVSKTEKQKKDENPKDVDKCPPNGSCHIENVEKNLLEKSKEDIELTNLSNKNYLSSV